MKTTENRQINRIIFFRVSLVETIVCGCSPRSLFVIGLEKDSDVLYPYFLFAAFNLKIRLFYDEQFGHTWYIYGNTRSLAKDSHFTAKAFLIIL